MKRDICYGEDFEERVAKYLEDNGHTVYRSVYANDGKAECQIDLVVFDGVLPIVIECKAWDAKSVGYKRSHNQWKYIHIDGSIKCVNNPIKQVKNHASILLSNMRDDIEHKLSSNCTVGGFRYCVFLKGDIKDYPIEHIYTERDYEKLLSAVTFDNNAFGNIFTDDYKTLMHSWLAEHSDTSKERLAKHIKYIKECKKNKTGLFDDNYYKY